MPYSDESPLATILDWLEQLRPMRIVLLTGASGPDANTLALRDLLENRRQDRRWHEHVPTQWRPAVKLVTVDEVDALDAGCGFDLAVCCDVLAELPAGTGSALLNSLSTVARFIVGSITTGRPSDAANWPTVNWQRSRPLAIARLGRRLACLWRGGAALDEMPVDQPRIWYLAPNRQIYGGVKILYNHVDILNSLGFRAVLATRQSRNFPASWFAWNPANLAFAGDAPAQSSADDIVVIPEFRWRDARLYRHTARRLLFVQNPGLAKGIEQWERLGYDGVLTLNIPDGRTSQLQQFLLQRCGLPIFAISNHYSDDPWGKTSAARVPGRILCLPRKGKEYVDRLDSDFGGIYRVDNTHQFQMAVEYAGADIYVHTGFPEGQPMPPIEAMLSGCIVCGFTGRGGLDVMIDGRTAYVAEDGNYEQLAAALRRAISDPNREQVRQAGQQIASQFTRQTTAAELTICYRRWLPGLPTLRGGRIAKLVRRLAFRH